MTFEQWICKSIYDLKNHLLYDYLKFLVPFFLLLIGYWIKSISVRIKEKRRLIKIKKTFIYLISQSIFHIEEQYKELVIACHRLKSINSRSTQVVIVSGLFYASYNRMTFEDLFNIFLKKKEKNGFINVQYALEHFNDVTGSLEKTINNFNNEFKLLKNRFNSATINLLSLYNNAIRNLQDGETNSFLDELDILIRSNQGKESLGVLEESYIQPLDKLLQKYSNSKSPDLVEFIETKNLMSNCIDEVKMLYYKDRRNYTITARYLLQDVRVINVFIELCSETKFQKLKKYIKRKDNSR